jgi:hypothetical protein
MSTQRNGRKGRPGTTTPRSEARRARPQGSPPPHTICTSCHCHRWLRRYLISSAVVNTSVTLSRVIPPEIQSEIWHRATELLAHLPL